MKNIVLFFFFLFLVGTSCADYLDPLDLGWSSYLQTDDIYLLDGDRDGSLEVYAVLYTRNSRSCIYSFSYKGRALGDECVPEFNRLRYPGASENVESAYVLDLDRDGFLDVVSALHVVGGGVNIKKVSIAGKQLAYGLNREEYKLTGEFAAEDHVTGILPVDLDSDSFLEILASSLDGKVYILNSGGGLLSSVDLGSGLHSVFAFDLDGDEELEILTSSSDSIFLLDSDQGSLQYSAIWSYPCNEPILSFAAGDLVDSSSGFVALAEENVYLFSNQTLMWKKTASRAVDVRVKDVDNDKEDDIVVLSREELYCLDSEGGRQWTYSSDERLSALEIDLYNNIFLGSSEHIYHFTFNPSYALNQRAEEVFDSAYSLYLEGRFSEAVANAAVAKQLFDLAGNSGGSGRADLVIVLAGNGTELPDKRAEAEKYYSEALSLFGSGELEEARSKAVLAMDLFLELNIKDRAIDSDILLGKVEARILSQKRSEAQGFISSARSAMEDGLFTSALDSAGLALKAYSDLNDSEGVTRAQALTEEIRLSEKLYYASEDLEKARQAFDSGNFQDAVTYSGQAKDAYDALGYSENASYASAFMERANLYANASVDYDFAVGLYEKDRLDEAQLHLDAARAIYVSLNDSERLSDCDFLSERIDSSRKNNLFGKLLLGLPLIFAGGVVFYMRKIRSR